MNASSSIEPLIAIAAIDGKAIPPTARQFATFSLFDWMVVARAGAEEPVSQIIRDFIEDEGGKPTATIVGSSSKAPARAAALANGTISHALDYDDTHFAHIGHLSVGVYPAALAAGEAAGASAAEVRDAFLVGAEASCRLGMVLGPGHYQRGFHQTATAGAFGATIAAGRIFGLSACQMRHALSLVSTRSSGLKSQFGTMGKPFNAGISAANGVEAAGLAKRGFISCEDGVSGSQGFVETHADNPDHQGPWKTPPPQHFMFEDIRYKLHACCHGTHAMIEALLEARRRYQLEAHEVTKIEVQTHPRWLRVCDVKEPHTGLEVKFSYALLAAMALHGIDTSLEKNYTAALCTDPALQKLAGRVEVKGDQSLRDTAARVVTEAGGKRFETAHDLATPLTPGVLEGKLQSKAKGLLGEKASEKLWSGIAAIDRLTAHELAQLLNG